MSRVLVTRARVMKAVRGSGIRAKAPGPNQKSTMILIASASPASTRAM